MAMRWKMEPKEIGLRSIGAGPRSSNLRDGGIELATVYAARQGYKVTGWYWVSRISGEVVNSCRELVADEATAKAQAMAHVKKHYKKG